jgi:RNA polymerase sigma factor (TIGR02999 family)
MQSLPWRPSAFMSDTDDPSLTQWLSQFDGPDPAAGRRLFEALYDELRRMARNHMRKENPGHTLSATALTHEAWFRMAEQSRTHWRSRNHFLAVASTMMRRILVNHEVARRTDKRQAEITSASLSGLDEIALPVDRDVLAVHESLLAFETVDARAAKVVELRFFGGLEIEEIAQVLELSPATVKRDWALAKAWLHRDLTASG